MMMRVSFNFHFPPAIRPFNKVIVCAILLNVLFTANVSGQDSFFFTGRHQHKEKIAFKFYRNLIVIPVLINGEGPFNFVLDSGVGISTITDPSLQKLLNLKVGKIIAINGLGNRAASEAYLSTGISLHLPGVQSLPLTLVVFRDDPFFLSTYLGIKVHGILGYEFFSSFIVKINYTEKMITLYSPGKFHPGNKYEAIPISIQSNKPFFKATCSFVNHASVDLNFLLDTGAGFPVSLESYSDGRIEIPDPHINTQLGLGLNGIIHGSLARIPELQIGKYKFEKVVTSFPDYEDWETKSEGVQRNGSVGNFLLKRFSVVFDYHDEKLFLRAGSKMDAAFEYDRAGIELVGGGDDYSRYIVFQVKSNSPAAEAGILPDDEIVELNYQNAKNFDLGSIDKMLSDAKAKNVMLKIKRGDDYLYILLKMRDLI